MYIYDAFSPVKERIPELNKDKLLLPPLLTNRLAWSNGYFETIENHPLGPMDVLVNGYLIAQGEVVVVNDKFGIRLTDIVTPSERLRRLSRG